MPNKSLEHQEIVRLLAKLKEETPEYPADMVEARKYSFMKQIVDLKISLESPAGEGKQPGGTGGQKGGGGSRGSGGSGAALGGGSTVLGISLKTVLAIGAVIVMLTAAYLFRDQIVEFLAENEIINTAETAAPSLGSPPVGPARETPPVGTPASKIVETEASSALENNGLEGTPGIGKNLDRSGGTPEQDSGQKIVTPTAPVQSGPFSFFQYLMCILQSGTDSCR